MLPAVRFGRIPKREKQRMLLEMQSAMTNMMNNNSQLQTNNPPKTSNHNPPCPADLQSGAPSSFSRAPSPQSDQSESSTDPESHLPMDTSQSSDSTATDSGEDEVTSYTGTGSNKESKPMMCEEQDVWNHHNDMATVTLQHPHSSHTSHNQSLQLEDNLLKQCPVRVTNDASSVECPAQPLNYQTSHYSSPGHSGQLHNENRVNGTFRGASWSGGNRMHLVGVNFFLRF